MKIKLTEVAIAAAWTAALLLAAVTWHLPGPALVPIAAASLVAILLVIRREDTGGKSRLRRRVSPRSWSFLRSAFVMALAVPPALLVGRLSEALGSLVLAGAAIVVVRMEGAARRRERRA
ncbi:MAG: hypothetical protein D6683_10270 [Actinomyces sp.]|nr:MAG: hypothetical protein D6683_10270 [Actinomyces sp.]